MFTLNEFLFKLNDVPNVIKCVHSYMDNNLLEEPSRIPEFVLWKRNNRYTRKDDVVVGLVHIPTDVEASYYAFGGIFRVTEELETDDGIGAKGYVLPDYSDFIGRAIFNFSKLKGTQGMKFNYQDYKGKIYLHSILPTSQALFTIDDYTVEFRERIRIPDMVCFTDSDDVRYRIV